MRSPEWEQKKGFAFSSLWLLTTHFLLLTAFKNQSNLGQAPEIATSVMLIDRLSISFVV